jgi:hypothetical protein
MYLTVIFLCVCARALSHVTCPLFRLLYNHIPDSGGSNHLRNVGKLLPDYTAEISPGFIWVSIVTTGALL